LLVANMLIILGIATVLGTRVWRLIKENRETEGGARLRLRIILLFCLAAAIPTVIVAGFLAVTINRSVEGWFSRPITNIVQGGAQAARAALDDVSSEATLEAQSIEADIKAAAAPQTGQASLDALIDYLKRRGQFRGIFGRMQVFDHTGAMLSTPLV